MHLLLVGISHHTAPVELRERLDFQTRGVEAALRALTARGIAQEAVVLSTCNRVEIIAEVPRFHPALADISAVISRHSGLPIADLADYLYVHFAEAAAEHVMSVAAGLDSMVVGESQILRR